MTAPLRPAPCADPNLPQQPRRCPHRRSLSVDFDQPRPPAPIEAWRGRRRTSSNADFARYRRSRPPSRSACGRGRRRDDALKPFALGAAYVDLSQLRASIARAAPGRRGLPYGTPTSIEDIDPSRTLADCGTAHQGKGEGEDQATPRPTSSGVPSPDRPLADRLRAAGLRRSTRAMPSTQRLPSVHQSRDHDDQPADRCRSHRGSRAKRRRSSSILGADGQPSHDASTMAHTSAGMKIRLPRRSIPAHRAASRRDAGKNARRRSRPGEPAEWDEQDNGQQQRAYPFALVADFSEIPTTAQCRHERHRLPLALTRRPPISAGRPNFALATTASTGDRRPRCHWTQANKLNPSGAASPSAPAISINIADDHYR